MSSLKIVDFVDSKGRHLDGLVAVASPKDATSSHERAILEDATRFEHISYVYFRRFSGHEGRGKRSSQIAAYVVDNSKQHLTPEVLAELHHKLWLHGAAPLVYVAWPTKVDILSCARKPDFWKKNTATRRYAPAETLQTAANISDELGKRRRLSAFRLAEGTFWDEPDNQKLAKDDAAAHRSLIQAIVDVDKELDGAKKPMRRRLLVLTILIKYLEDRQVFPAGLFGRFHKGARSFLEILRDGTVESVTRLLKYLETEKFNGDVFALGDYKAELTTGELQQFAKLVEARTLGRQKHFWELFSFEHIPVEVISRLYQRFVTGHGAVYTPPFLAALLLDQVMPYDSMTGKEKILDPACGSGIFLVGAFKRLVTHWRSRHRWQRPTAEQLKALLLQSIYGVEMESAAVDLTAFSLSLAICDALHPDAIWKDLRFEKLRERNVREGDFFDTETTISSNHSWPDKFDVIVGNPPFDKKLTHAAFKVDSARPKTEPKLPFKQIAYLFLEKSLMSLVPGGCLCMIQPHGVLYNGKSTDFRRHLMTLARLDSILDFVSMRGMYEGADPKTVAWHAFNEPASGQPINHITFRRTYSASERIAFEIDHYDWHMISQLQANDNSFVWRVGLLGGGRLLDLSTRLTTSTLRDYVKKRQWVYSEGFKLGEKKNVEASLTGKLHLPTTALTVDGIDESQLSILKQQWFEAPRDINLYEPPLVVIKEHESLPVAYWDRCHLNFMRSIVGVHGKASDRKALQAFAHELTTRRRLFQFCLLLNGSRALTGRSTAVNKLDIDRLPMPDDPTELDLAFWEDSLKEDVLEYMADYVRLGQDSVLLKKAASTANVKEFSSLYVRMLGSLYRNLKSAESIRMNGLIAQPFYFGDKPDVSWLDDGCKDALHRLVYDQSRESLRTVRVVRYYEGNVILIVKPDRLRYWIRSTAIRDADDTLIDLREQGW